MDSLLLILFLVFIGIPVFIVFLSYIIPKKLGYIHTAKYLSKGIAAIFLGLALYLIFEDFFFTKNNAIDLLKKEQVNLTDEFKLKDNRSLSAIGDYYHTFTLYISEEDKKRIIKEIKSSEKFHEGIFKEEEISIGPHFTNNTDRNNLQFAYYETEDSYISERYTPNKPGYAPDFVRVSIDKKENKLIYEDIGE